MLGIDLVTSDLTNLHFDHCTIFLLPGGLDNSYWYGVTFLIYQKDGVAENRHLP